MRFFVLSLELFLRSWWCHSKIICSPSVVASHQKKFKPKTSHIFKIEIIRLSASLAG